MLELFLFARGLPKISVGRDVVDVGFTGGCISDTSSTVTSLWGFLSEGSVKAALSLVFLGSLVFVCLVFSGTSMVLLLNLYCLCIS